MRSIGDITLTKSPHKETGDNSIVDYFTTKDGQTFAGLHLLVELWGSKNLNEADHIDAVLRDAAKASGATILHSHMHNFSPFDGVSGVVLLAESHISIHTWPERAYAAIDIFMCGSCDPKQAVPVLESGFSPEKLSYKEIRRGIVEST